MPKTKKTTIGNLLLKDVFPEKIHPLIDQQPIDKNRIKELLSEVADEYDSETYREVVQKLHELGNEVAVGYGNEASLTFPDSFLIPDKARKERINIREDLEDIRNSNLPKEEKKNQILLRLRQGKQKIKDVVSDEMKNTSFPLQLLSGARGSEDQLLEMIAGGFMAMDPKGNYIDAPILHGYGEGLTPAEYWATSFGARSGYIGTKMSTPRGGHIANQLALGALRERVTQKEEPESKAGLEIDPTDADYIGAVLAEDVDNIAKKGDVLTPKLAKRLNDKDSILVHSPITSQSPHGISQQAAGKREGGRFPEIGAFEGITAVQALCIVEGTKVQMADGSEKNIENINPGDKVIGCSKKGVTKPVEVLDIYDNGIKECFHTGFYRNGSSDEVLELNSTRNHKILSKEGVKPLKNLFDEEDPKIKYLDNLEVKEASVAYYKNIGENRVYDLHINHPDHLFMLGNGLIVSNSEPISQSQICLCGGTLVQMADGSEKNIENISAGEKVLGCSKEGEVEPVEVLKKYNNGKKKCFHTEFLGRGPKDEVVELNSTSHHKILSKKGVRPVGELYDEKDPKIIYFDTELKEGSLVLHRYIGMKDTYDIEVDHPDHLFLLANGLVVSNSAKHQGQRTVGGLDLIEQLLNMPKNFQNAAAISEKDGVVKDIKELSTGAKVIKIGDKEYKIPKGAEPKVKPGQHVERGEVLSEGIPNPKEIAKYRGIGEARKKFVDIFSNALNDSDIPHNKRNIEYISKGIMNHVNFNEPYKDYLPGDIVEYSKLSREWEPRENAEEVKPNRRLIGRYLEEPVLHYTIGTQVTPSMAERIKNKGIQGVMANKNPPPFEPDVRRALEATQHADWLTRLGGYYLKGSTMDALLSGNAPSSPGDPENVIPQIITGGEVQKIQ